MTNTKAFQARAGWTSYRLTKAELAAVALEVRAQAAADKARAKVLREAKRLAAARVRIDRYKARASARLGRKSTRATR